MKTKRIQLTVVSIATILLTFTSSLLLCAVEERAIDSVVPFVPGKMASLAGEDSPFGIMAAFDPVTLTTINATDKVAWAGEHFRNLGAKWSRNGGDAIIWILIEPEFGKGYDWSNLDEALKKAYGNGGGNFNTVGVINPQRGKGGNPDIPSGKEDYYSKFVEALVERYDGDGVADYSLIIKVKYWQMANEPFPRQWETAGGTIDGYVKFAELTHNAIKKSDPNAKIILGTFQLETSEDINKFKEVIPKMKNKNLFDYIDTHYWKSGNDYKIPVGEARNVLDSNGYSNAKMVALESGTWAEMRGRGTEKDQANYLIKEYAYNIAHGFSLINWNNLVEWKSFGGDTRNIYNFMGLIADGENGDPIPAGTPRLSYYTYKKMTETLEGSDWNNIQTIQESDGIYIYKFIKDGVPIYVAWNDNTAEKQITISGITTNHIQITEAIPHYDLGKDVTDYTNAFNISELKYVPGGEVNLTLNDVPVFIEEMPQLNDVTPPVTPLVSDEGQFTVKSSQLYAQWTAEDVESGIVEYQYRITQDAPEVVVIRDWTSTGTYNYVTAGNLGLLQGKKYFFAVKAKNGAGLESEIGYADGITVDITPPQTTDSGIDGLWHNQPVTVTLTAADSVSGVDKTYYSTDGTGPSILYSAPFTLSSDGVYTVKYYSVDKAGNTEAIKTASEQVKIDKTSPSGTVLINNNASYTTSTAVTLNFSATDTGGSGVSQMVCFSFDSASWLTTPQPYATTKSWTLTSNNGTKTVYAKFKDAAGNWSGVYSDTIILDTTSPTITNISDAPDPFDPEAGQSSKISYVLRDNLSSPLYVYVFIYNSSGSPVNAIIATQSLGSRYFSWNGRSFQVAYVPDGTYKYRIKAQDMAGNYVYSGYYYVTKK